MLVFTQLFHMYIVLVFILVFIFIYFNIHFYMKNIKIYTFPIFLQENEYTSLT